MRRTAWRGISFLTAAVLWAGGSGRAAADIFAVQDLTVNSFMGGGSNLVYGWEFTTNATITVTKLGWYDHGFDGLATTHQAGIFDTSTMQLLVSTSIGPGSAGPIEGPPVHVNFGFPDSGGFRYVDIPPTTLNAGASFVIVGTDPIGGMDTAAFFFPMTINILVTDPALTFVQGRNQPSSGSTLVFPTQTFPTFAAFGPTFQFQVGPVAAVPEPGSVALLGLGLAAVLGWRCRRRKAAA